MSDNKTVPSAEAILKEKGITGLTANHNYQYLHRSILEAMHKHTRLHLEAMAKEIAEKAKLEEEIINMQTSAYSIDKKSIIEAATDYISKLK